MPNLANAIHGSYYKPGRQCRFPFRHWRLSHAACRELGAPYCPQGNAIFLHRTFQDVRLAAALYFRRRGGCSGPPYSWDVLPCTYMAKLNVPNCPSTISFQRAKTDRRGHSGPFPDEVRTRGSCDVQRVAGLWDVKLWGGCDVSSQLLEA